MGKAPTIPPIQFTKAELRLIEKGMVGMTVEWLNGYQSTTRQYAAASVTRKVRAVLYPSVPEKRSSGGSA